MAAFVLLLLMLTVRVQAEGTIRSTVSPTGFGYNIDDALINPTEPGKSETELTEQVAGILHAVRMDGGRTVRWFVTGVWPQYQCARDPENQATGELDPAWFTISRVLLQEAQKEGISVIVVMADTANGTFAGLPRDDEKRTAVIARWQQHQSTPPRAASTVDCRKSFQNGYHGRINPEAIFEDPELQPLFAARFHNMAEFLRTFPALAALEMFNEPDFAETQRPEFGRSIARIRHLIYDKDPSLRSVPIYSGVSAWNEKIAQGLTAAGELNDEPYINVHDYPNSAVGPQTVTRKVGELIAYVRRIVPGKPVIIAEAGAGDSIHDVRAHSDFFHALLAAKRTGQAGMWMWGTYADDSAAQPDFKWEFTSSALSGGTFRDILVAADREDPYRQGKSVVFTSASPRLDHREQVSIGQIAADDPNQLWRLRWQIVIGPDRFISLSRAGILLRLSPDYKDVFAEPGPGIAISAANQDEWAEISRSGDGWQIKIYRCQEQPTSPAFATPPYVPNYASKLGNKNFGSCHRSTLVDSARL